MLVLAGLVACGGEETALVLEVDSEMMPPEVDSIRLEVQGPGFDGGGRETTALLTGPEARELPLRLMLLHKGGPYGPYDFIIEGRNAGTVVSRLRNATPLAFEPGRRVVRRFRLLRPGARDPDDAGTTVPVSADAGAAPVPMADAGTAPVPISDAGVTPSPNPAPMDAAAAPRPVPDAAAGCPGTNRECEDGKGCECTSGCGCRLQCRAGQDCKPKCDGSGTSCTVVVSGASNADVSCHGGSRCTVDGRGKTSNLTVVCKESTCEVDCTGDVSNCRLECRDRSQCLLKCQGTSNCAIEECASGQMSCPGNVRVCGRPCP